MAPAEKALTHLERLEAESIHIMREVVAETEGPVMLYSIGKDSAVMLHLARKAFYPAPPPFPLLHVDTTWKFKDDVRVARPDGARERHAAARLPESRRRRRAASTRSTTAPLHTDMWKTEGLKQALDKYGFDAAFGGARRDEEKSRAKERVFSFRSANHRWDPKNQRPELWNLYNAQQGAGREHPRIPALQLDRARHLAIHPSREHPDRAAVFRRAAADGRARRACC